ncbi:DNA internalization-related competence protein ComEC/Rec2 [Tannockella kyphosi]|uniref:DNA internalization-related competence protein ComEC/Rec2 n=1 Tax=Tannockella kyphosi TaxID=2899121 RepID=UPI00201350C9|nr:DNA internalization-related competence protein ComEC/Rec2 [Tannockella kyphosi]
MALKHQLPYYFISILLAVVSKHVHILFVLGYIPFFILLHHRITKKEGISILVITILFLLTAQYPKEISDEVIYGQVVDVDEDQIVVKVDGAKVVVFGEFEDVCQKDYIELKVEYQEFTPVGNDSGFDYQRYLLSNGICQYAYLVEIEDYQQVNSLFRILKERFSSEELIDSFASLFLLGIKDTQMEELYTQMSALSIVYLFALSGLHIQYLKKWLYQILQFFISPKWLEIVIYVIIGFYIYIIPYNISFLRAYLVMVLYRLFKKYLSQLDILAIVTIFMIYSNPYVIFHLSFLFSYFIYFIVLITRNCKMKGFYIYLASIPIIIYIQYMIPSVSFLLGFLLTPIVSVLYQGLLWYALLGGIVKPFLLIILYFFDNLFVFFDAINFYICFSDPPLLFYLSYYFYFFLAILKSSVGKKNGLEIGKVMAIIVAFHIYSKYSLYTQVVMIDVGQGDCFLIQNSFNQGNILIDTGGSVYYDVATSTVIPYLRSIGISSLDAVFISHDDYDHSGGLESLEANFDVKEVIREDQDISYTYGDVFIELLQIPRDSSEGNESSLIMYVTVQEDTYLFAGDIGYEIEELLIDYYPDLQVDVLKVSHHGSSSSSSDAFLAWLQPNVALISCGLDNSYGHPSDIVLERFESLGIPVYRSDLMGMVRLVSYGEATFIYP